MSAILGVPVDAAYHLAYALTNFLTPVLGGLAAVAAIVLFTAAVRLIVMPLSFRALRGQAAAARLAPRVAALRKRYAAKPERFKQELSALYKREGTSMFAGFGPILAQWPVFSVLYLLFRSPVVSGGPNRLLSRHVLGVPLGNYWLSGAGAFSLHGAVFAGVFAILAAICWLSARVARRMSAALAGSAAPQAHGGPELNGAPQLNGTLGKVLPYITVVIAAFAPLAAGIYLVTSTAWSVAEREFFARSHRRGRVRRDPDAGPHDRGLTPRQRQRVRLSAVAR
jgi:YidC/Oxa1 family membrane protein insertase